MLEERDEIIVNAASDTVNKAAAASSTVSVAATPSQEKVVCTVVSQSAACSWVVSVLLCHLSCIRTEQYNPVHVPVQVAAAKHFVSLYPGCWASPCVCHH